MKRYLNLLPKEEQASIALERLTSRLIVFFILVTASLLLLSLLFFSSRLWLQNRVDAFRDQIELQKSLISKEENQKLKQQLQEFNGDLKNLVTLQQQHVLWSEVLIALARLIPSDIALDRMEVSRAKGAVTIAGFARTRESILQLRAELLASGLFTNVDFPLTNITKPKDAYFHYTFSVELKSVREQ